MLRGGVFISYRSDPSVDFAGRLYLYLAHVFGSDYVFLDSHITPGFDFMKVIVGSIPRSAVFLSVVDETWHTRKGRRALYKPDDPVRVEVETALRGQPLVTVIPIYVNQTKALRARRLPAGLAQLAGINGFRIHSKTFEADGERLVAAVRDELTRPRPPAREDSGRAGRDGPTRKAAFDAIRGFGKARKGYDFRQVITGLEDVLSRISDPDWCTELQPPFFDLTSRGDGFSVPEVDRYIIGRRPAASNFDQGLRWMFADQGLLGAGVPTETRASARLRERVGMVSRPAVPLRRRSSPRPGEPWDHATGLHGQGPASARARLPLQRSLLRCRGVRSHPEQPFGRRLQRLRLGPGHAVEAHRKV